MEIITNNIKMTEPRKNVIKTMFAVFVACIFMFSLAYFVNAEDREYNVGSKGSPGVHESEHWDFSDNFDRRPRNTTRIVAGDIQAIDNVPSNQGDNAPLDKEVDIVPSEYNDTIDYNNTIEYNITSNHTYHGWNTTFNHSWNNQDANLSINETPKTNHTDYRSRDYHIERQGPNAAEILANLDAKNKVEDKPFWKKILTYLGIY